MTAKAHPFVAWKLDMEALGYSTFCPDTGVFLAHKYSKYWYLLLIYLGICWTDRPCFIYSFNIYIECLPYTQNWGRSWVCSGEQNRHKPLLTKCFINVTFRENIFGLTFCSSISFLKPDLSLPLCVSTWPLHHLSCLFTYLFSNLTYLFTFVTLNRETYGTIIH